MRSSVIASASLALVALFASPAFAQEPATPDAPPSTAKESARPESGLELGARLGFGYALGKGSADAPSDMSDTISGQIPLIVDVGYRINKNIYVGGYGQYGFGIVKSDQCPSPASCSIQSYRLGVNVHYHFLPDDSFDPWIGVGTGYEWLHSSAEQGSSKSSSTASGFELVNFQVGGDYHLSRNASIGPFASISVAQYSNVSAEVNGRDLDPNHDIQNTALHEWLTLGVRGSFDL